MGEIFLPLPISRQPTRDSFEDVGCFVNKYNCLPLQFTLDYTSSEVWGQITVLQGHGIKQHIIKMPGGNGCGTLLVGFLGGVWLATVGNGKRMFGGIGGLIQ